MLLPPVEIIKRVWPNKPRNPLKIRRVIELAQADAIEAAAKVAESVGNGTVGMNIAAQIRSLLK